MRRLGIRLFGLVLLGAVISSASLTSVAAQGAADFGSCLDSLRAEALGRGVSDRTVTSATSGLEPNDAPSFEANQPEFSTPPWDYMAGLVDDERIADGRARFADQSATLSRVKQSYGVDPAIVTAVWGVESDFGRSFGRRPVIQSLATLSCFGRKPAFYRGEFLAALRILDRGDVSPDRFNGSWAGAFGHTQFMPSTFLRYGVDFEGNGHPDIVDSVPDALATTAAYLRASGWQAGLPWGFEVKLPDGYTGPSGRKNRRTAGFWVAKGIRRIDGEPLGDAETGLLLPSGPSGPAFLVTRNFDALFAYNAAEIYALAIGHLADRIRGAGPIATAWPTDDPGLSRIERKDLQSLLQQRGYAVEKVDGVLGTKTREAIADYQQRIGLTRDGRGSFKVMQALKSGR